jgi:hypothetical protein
VILSILGGIGYAVLHGLGTVVTNNGGTTTSGSVAGSARSAEYDAADNFRITIPKSVWDKGMERAVKKHCFIPGMNEEEVARALGEPSTKASLATGDTWTWLPPGGKCLKYDGDTCVEKEKHEQIVFFTPKGNAWNGIGCQTLKSDFAYYDSSDLFKNLPTPATETKRAKVGGQISLCQLSHPPIPMEASKKMFCWDPHDGNPERGPFATREAAIEAGLHGYY